MEKIVKPVHYLDAHRGTIVSIVQPLDNSDYILTLSNDKLVLLWNLSLGNLINEICSDACPTKLFIFPNLRFLLIPKWSNIFSLIDLSLFNLSIKKIINIYFPENEKVFIGHKSWILNAIEFDDKFLTCGRDKTIRLWNIKSQKCELIFSEHKQNVNYLIKLNKGLFASCSSDNYIKIWNLKLDANNPRNSILSILDGNLPVFQIEKLDDICLVSRNESPTMKIWNYTNGNLIKILEGHFTNVICMTILKNGNILSGSYDHTAKIWNKKFDNPSFTLSGHEFTVYNVCECKNGNILTASGDGSIKLWDLNKKRCLMTFIGHDDYVVSMLVTKNNEFVSGSYDGAAIIWKIKY